MPRTTNTIVIGRPVTEVFDFVENPANDAIWRAGVVAAPQDEPAVRQVGTTGREAFHILGRDFETTWEITAYQADHKVAYRSTSGPFEYETVWLYEMVDGGTRISIEMDWSVEDPTWAGALTDRLLEMFDERRMAKDLAALKKLLEA